MAPKYSIDDWIKDRLNAEQARIDEAIERGRILANAITSTTGEESAAEPRSYMIATPSLKGDDWLQGQWLKAELSFGWKR